jgi:DNA-binding beta-propeller fold protein YncE
LCLVCLLFCLASNGHGSGEPEKPLDTTTYYSEDKGYALKIIPSSRYGEGRGDYILSKKGKTLWEKTEPFTLREVKISKEGIIVGFSYDQGFEGGIEGGRMSLISMDKNGNILFSKNLKRNYSGQLHSPAFPICKGVVLHEQLDKAFFRVYPASPNQYYEKWFRISLSTGKEDQAISPSMASGAIETVVVLPDLPYILLFFEHSGSYPSKDAGVSYGKSVGSTFVLMALDGSKIWSEKNADDLDFQAIGCEQREVYGYCEKNDLIGFGPAPRDFWVSHLKRNDKVTYSIVGSKVQLSKTENLHWRKNTTEKQAGLVSSKLKFHGAPRLLYSFKVVDKDSNADCFQHIRDFDFNDEKELAFVCKYDGVFRFGLLGKDNLPKVCTELDTKDWGPQQPACFRFWKEDKWLLLLGGYEESARLFVINSQGKIQKEIKINIPGGMRLVVDGEKNITIFSRGGRIFQINGEGKQLWSWVKGYGEEGGLLSPEDMAISGDQEIGVLDNIAQKIVFYTKSGKYLRTIEFKKTKSGELDYPVHLAISKEGTIYVKDEAGQHRLHRYSKDGKWLGAISMKRPDGQGIGYIGDMRVDTTGRLWVSDDIVFGINDKGETGKTFGILPQANQIQQVSALDTDSSGNLYIFDETSYVVTKFTGGGKRLVSFGPKPEEIPRSRFFEGRPLFIDKSNIVFMTVSEKEYMKFSSEGVQSGRINFSGNPIAQKKTGFFWCSEYHLVNLLNSRGEKTLEISRGHNEKWFEGISHIYCSYSGLLLVDDYKRGFHTFNEKGKSLTSFEVDSQWLYPSGVAVAEDRLYFAYTDQNAIRVLDFSGKEIALFPDPQTLRIAKPRAIHVDELNKKLFVGDENSIHVFGLSEVR